MEGAVRHILRLDAHSEWGSLPEVQGYIRDLSTEVAEARFDAQVELIVRLITLFEVGVAVTR